MKCRGHKNSYFCQDSKEIKSANSNSPLCGDHSFFEMATKQRKGSRSSGRNTSSANTRKGGNFLRRIFITPIRDTFSRDKVGFVFGAILLAIALYTTIAIGSFFVHGGVDQSVVRDAPVSDILLGRAPVANLCGIRGAVWSEWLMNGLFGFGTLFLLFYVFSLSLKLMGVVKRISVVKRLIFCGVMTFWTSLAAAFIYKLSGLEGFLRWGGMHGQEWTLFLERNIGKAGLIIVLLVLAVIIAVVVRSECMGFFRRLLGLSWISIPKLPKKERKNNHHESENESLGNGYDRGESENLSGYLNNSEYEDSPAGESADDPDDYIPPHKEEGENDSSQSIQMGSMTVELAQEEEKADEALLAEIKTDPRMDLASYKFPSVDLLTQYDLQQPPIDMNEIEENQKRIIATLDSFKIHVTPIKATVGPTVTLYEVAPDSGIKISRIRNLEDDIAMSLKAVGGIRIIAPMPGKGTIGIEVPNRKPQTVSMYSVLTSKKYQESDMDLPVALGKTITNEVFIFDLCKMPHLLIAGATGQGKSVGLNAMITSLLYKKHPAELKFVLVDPKMLEFAVYEAIERHYLAKLPDEDRAIVTDMTKVVPTLNSLCIEMDNRYRMLTEARVRNIKEYNDQIISGKLSRLHGHKFLPYIVLIVDEFADLIMTSGKEVERPITRIAQKARAAGIHMVVATQRPSTDIITGIIKANFPARIAFKVFSMIDSRTILDQPGANQLVGRGDMLFYQGKDTVRLQCAFLDTPECEAVTHHISLQESYTSAYELPEYVPEGEEGGPKAFNPQEKDPLFEEVARMVVNSQQGSTSNIQRKFNIGYNRAGRLMDQLEGAGIVSPQDGSKPRQVLIQDEMSLERLFETLR